MGAKVQLIIFDCDRTLVETASGDRFRQRAEDWEVLPGRKEKCAELHAAGIKLAMVRNSADVAFDYSRFTEQQLRAELALLAEFLQLDMWKACYTTPNVKALPQYQMHDNYRLPGVGMLTEISNEFGILPEHILCVGALPELEQAAQEFGAAWVPAYVFFEEK